jgi:hypothetical protein
MCRKWDQREGAGGAAGVAAAGVLLALAAAGTGLHLRAVVDLAAEDFAVHRRQGFVQHAVHRAACQRAGQRLLPGHDGQHLGQFAVADDLGAVDVGAVLRDGGARPSAAEVQPISRRCAFMASPKRRCAPRWVRRALACAS